MSKLSKDKVLAGYNECLNNRAEYDVEWKSLVEYLLPGRGMFTTPGKQKKRQLSSPKSINTIAEESLGILTSGMHSSLTSPARPWFHLGWADQKLNQVEPLKMWLQQSEQIIQATLQASNFYSIINSFYTEYAGFGLGCIYIGSDSEQPPVNFELLTVGEYAYALGADGKVSDFYRVIPMSPAQIVEMFPNTASTEVKEIVKESGEGKHTVDRYVLEYITKQKYMDKPYTQIRYEVPSVSTQYTKTDTGENDTTTPLSKEGFYEMPYAIARWDIIGRDTYAVGLGSKALRQIKRLQEMEKAGLMALHKALDPPVNAPARMKNKLNTLPGGKNYYTNPQEVVTEIYQGRVDLAAANMAIERVEQRIQRIFCVDIFLTASRDPNASPYKAAEVIARDQEKMIRLGPVVERLGPEMLEVAISRIFNVLLRKQLLPPLDPKLAQMAGEYRITLVSPLAVAQRAAEMQGINQFLGFIGQAAQFNQEVLDNVDVDAAARDIADISGVRLGILRPQEAVGQMRKTRVEMMQQEKAKQDQLAMAQARGQVATDSAQARKAAAEAGLIQLQGQELAANMGM
jgi:hypothetical protein